MKLRNKWSEIWDTLLALMILWQKDIGKTMSWSEWLVNLWLPLSKFNVITLLFPTNCLFLCWKDCGIFYLISRSLYGIPCRCRNIAMAYRSCIVHCFVIVQDIIFKRWLLYVLTIYPEISFQWFSCA